MAKAAPAEAKPIDAATNAAADVFIIFLSMMYLSVFLNTLIERVTADTGGASGLFQNVHYFLEKFALSFQINGLGHDISC
ncbi:hypothetical protein [Maritalea mediterranea]|uniref:Uncharacterized protein n=1 Tax=Maritalea mediterranea TaxID=2909667 RepID=A0ABS9E636_9HYPH|nr:hypothetical protein [Maritalea mediterranea]MCF4096931.1 hypothetical protein [Maritalea mediterranea]